MRTATSSRRALLLVISDPELLDLLTRAFEERGHVVALAVTTRQAVSHLESAREFDVVVAAWDARHPVGGEVYRWALAHQPRAETRFVFVADEPAPEFDAQVGGRWLAISPHDAAELVRVVDAAAHDARPAALPAPDRAVAGNRPTLLLADDDPFQLSVMSEILREVGFQVTACDGGNAAIARLESEDFDVVLSDWHMPLGHGRDLHRWICTDRPWMMDRLVFLTGGDPREPERSAPGIPVFPKGQDAESLLAALTALAQRARRAS